MNKEKEFKLNALMRSIIEKDYKGNSSAFARAVKRSKQVIFNYYHNKKRLGWRAFVMMAEQTGHNVKVSLEKN